MSQRSSDDTFQLGWGNDLLLRNLFQQFLGKIIACVDITAACFTEFLAILEVRIYHCWCVQVRLPFIWLDWDFICLWMSISQEYLFSPNSFAYCSQIYGFHEIFYSCFSSSSYSKIPPWFHSIFQSESWASKFPLSRNSFEAKAQQFSWAHFIKPMVVWFLEVIIHLNWLNANHH